MIKTNKLVKILIFVLTSILLLSLFACDGANAKKVSLAELPDTMEAGYKTTFELPHVLKNGKSITYKVFDSDGKEVSIMSSSFLVEKNSNYIAKATVGASKKDITIIVKDFTAPVILSSEKELRYVLVGSDVDLPTFTVVDNLDEEPITVCSLTNNDGDVEFDENKFTPTVAGEYIYKVTCKDSSQNATEKQFVINAVDTIEATYKVFAFDVSSDYVDYMTDFTVSFNTDEKFCFNGELGSTKMSLNTGLTDPVFAFKNQLIDTSEFTKLYYYVFNDSDYDFTFNPNIASGGYANASLVKAHEWSIINIVNMDPHPYSPSMKEDHSDITGMVTSCNRAQNDHYGKEVNFYFSAVYGVK